MYISDGLGVLTILPFAVIVAVVLEWPLAIVLIISLLRTVISVPLLLRCSRLIWLTWTSPATSARHTMPTARWRL